MSGVTRQAKEQSEEVNDMNRASRPIHRLHPPYVAPGRRPDPPGVGPREAVRSSFLFTSASRLATRLIHSHSIRRAAPRAGSGPFGPGARGASGG